MNINKNLNSLLLLLLLGFIWGTGYSIARFATTHGVPPLGYSFWQSLGPAILIGFLSLAMNIPTKHTSSVSNGNNLPRSSLHYLSIPHLRYYLICGLTGIVIPNTNMYFAAPHLPAGLLAVIVNTVPIIAYPMALFAGVEAFRITRFFGVILAITGLMFIVLPKSSLPSSDMIPWVLSALITPFAFAFCAIYIARYRPEKGDSLPLAAGTLIASTIMLFPFVILSGNFYSFHYPLSTPDCVILLEIVLSSIGYILLFQLIKMAGPVYYSLVDVIVAMTGLFWGYVIFNEHLNIWTSSAVVLILLSLLFVSNKQK